MSQVELVRATTEDLVRLEGALQTVVVDSGSPRQLDAMILLHGVAAISMGRC